MAGGVMQMVKFLPSKHETLSNSHAANKEELEAAYCPTTLNSYN
jgi:hypothetical protein